MINHKIDELYMNFRIMAVIESFGQPTVKRIENLNEAVSLYSIVNKCFKDEYRHSRVLNKIVSDK